MTKPQRLCMASLGSDTDAFGLCRRPAKFQYSPVAGFKQYLCGIHSKGFKKSPNLVRLETK